MTATADAALFDALNALGVADDAAEFGMADAMGALRGWAVVVMGEPPQAQGKSGGLRGKYGAGGQRGCRLSAIGFQRSAKNNKEQQRTRTKETRNNKEFCPQITQIGADYRNKKNGTETTTKSLAADERGEEAISYRLSVSAMRDEDGADSWRHK